MANRCVWGLVVVVGGGLLGAALGAQAPTSTAAGVFTADQAKRGQSVYADACAKCHLDDLSGGATSPPLKGSDFLSGWTGKSVGALLDEIKMTMPFDSPGSLTAAQYADVLAYILSANDFPAGTTELGQDSGALQQVKIEKSH